jgi:signal transduction histidine kinase
MGTRVRWVLALLVPATTLFLWTGAIAWWSRDAPAATWFAVVTGIWGTGAGVLGFSILLGINRALLIGTVLTLGLIIPVPWLLFCLTYTGRGTSLSNRMIGVVSTIPAMGLLATGVVLVVEILPSIRLPAQQTATGLRTASIAFLSNLQWISVLYAGGLTLVGTGFLLWTFQKYDHLESNTGVLLGTLGTVPWLAVLFGLRLDRTAPLILSRTVGIGLFVGSIVAAGALSQFNLFDRVPAAENIGPVTVFEELNDLVVVTDKTGRVVELNAAAEQTLEVSPSEIVGAGVTDIFGASIDSLRETTTLDVSLESGRWIFEPTVSALTDQNDRQLGYAIVFRDVTVRTTRRQRLEVFNRVLRHNLRNETTIILGHADTLRRVLEDPEHVDNIEKIIESTTDLTNLSKEVREIDKMVEDTDLDGVKTSLDTIVENVITKNVTPDIHVKREIPSQVVIEGGSDVLELALGHLVENAFEHNDSESPTVEVRADVDLERTYSLHISVLDDGPGIPSQEIQAINEGTETKLEHGSGLGLWVVRWVTTQMGGNVEFRERSAGGTAVSIQLPASWVDTRPVSA